MLVTDPFSACESQIFNDDIDGFIGDNVTAVGGHKATPLRDFVELMILLWQVAKLSAFINSTMGQFFCGLS
jgi:hypothetical protein